MIKTIEWYNAYGLDAFDMCLVPDMVVPPKFKSTEFKKYKGLSCPKNYLIMYFWNKVLYAHNDQLLIHFFQDNLTRASLNWYMDL